MNICVFCSSSSLVPEDYKKYAYELGSWIARKGHTLVYGGATGGLMDEVARGASDAEGDIIGIIPDVLINSGRKSELPTQTLIVSDMAERKSLMAEMADLFIALPGGVGTLDEIFSVLCSQVVGEIEKNPMLIFSPNNYWSGLEAQIERIKADGAAYKFDGLRYAFVPELEQIKEQILSLE